MSAAERQLIEVRGHVLAVEGAEFLYQDIRLGEILGYERPRDIRKLIDRLEEEGKITGVQRRATVARRGFAEENVEERWLTRAQLLYVVAKSETENAHAILCEMIEVYDLALQGRLGEASAAAGGPAAAPAMDVQALTTLAARVAATVAVGIVQARTSRRDRGAPAEQLSLDGLAAAASRLELLRGRILEAVDRSQIPITSYSALARVIRGRKIDVFEAAQGLVNDGLLAKDRGGAFKRIANQAESVQ